MEAAFAGKPAPTGDGYICQMLVGCKAAFASKPAPTGDGYICQMLVGCKAAFASKPAPTGDWAHQEGQSAGRPPSLASQRLQKSKSKAAYTTPLFTTHQAER
ncbi:hypothetical protein CGA21_03585 [Pseudomonas sp. PSB11]|nr:hypothetical protein [Pseudomonas sp. PSB11]